MRETTHQRRNRTLQLLGPPRQTHSGSRLPRWRVAILAIEQPYANYSIPLSAKGDITNSDTITRYEQDAAPYVPSPVLYEGQLYFVKSNNGVLVSPDAKTGELLIDQTRLTSVC